MGKLGRIEVFNFKSYKGKQIIGPFKDFTCVIGPNGAGKSNLVDAISFVMGVRASHLRGSHLADLIYRLEGESTTTRSANVTLVYINDDGTEIKFSRSINPAGKSEYSIDNKTVTWAAYEEKLKSLSLLVKARNFLVFQGDVESIATKSPKQLAAFIEQIAGSDELRDSYAKLLEQQNEAEQNTVFNFQKQKGINAEKRQFKEQKKEAETYKQKKKQLEFKRREHILWQLFYIEQETKTFTKALKTKQSKIEQQKKMRDSVVSNLRKKKAEQAKAHKKSTMIRRNIRKIEKQIDETTPEKVKIEEGISHLEKKINKQANKLAQLKEEIADRDNNVKLLESRLKEVEQAEKQWLEEQEENEGMHITLLEDQLEQYNNIKEQVALKTAEQRADLNQLKRQQELSVQSLTNKEKTIKELQASKEPLPAQIKNLATRKEKITVVIQESRLKQTQLQQELSAMEKDLAKTQALKLKLTEKIAEKTAQLRDAKAEKKESERDRQFERTLENLNRLFIGVRGRLGDLCKPTQKQYEVAVVVALGRHFDAIVVDDEKTAIECISYMREQRMGTALFIPLDSIKVVPINESMRNRNDNVKLILDLISYDKSLKRAVQFAVGNALFCETLTEARTIAFSGSQRYKVVTKIGEVIHASGLMTGGMSSAIQGKSKKWQQNEIEKLKQQRDKFVQELTDCNRKLRQSQKEQQLNTQLSGINSRISYAEMDVTLTTSKITDATNKIKHIDERVAQLQPEVAELKGEIANSTQAISDLETKIFAVEDKLFSSLCASLGVSNIREYEEQQMVLAQKATEKKLEFSNLKARLTNELEYEQSRDLQKGIQRTEKRIAMDKKELTASKQELKKMEKASSQLQDKLATEKKTHEQAKQIVEDKETEINELKKKEREVLSTIRTIQKDITSDENQVEQLNARRHNLFKDCKVLQIDLPQIEQDEEDEEDEMDLSEDAESTQSSQGMRAVYAKEQRILLDFSTLDKKKRGKKSTSALKQMHRQYLEEIKTLEHEVNSMDPNLKAIAQYKNVSERLADTKEALEDARSIVREAKKKFETVKQQRYDKFMEAFTSISINIDKIYKSLTRDDKHPGGTAYLHIENAEDPYLGGIKYNAMPPSKRFRDMEQLSGGEKTVAALALLFAIHAYQPSPFFVLDEVDAALDRRNISKVTKYISSRVQDENSPLQFIVISLQDRFFEKADALVGVVVDASQRCSKTLTFDLTNFDE